MNDWKSRAEREAVALVNGANGPLVGSYVPYDRLIELVALGWLHGAIVATHMDLQALEEGADATRAAL